MQKYGYEANNAGHKVQPCLICDTENPIYSWTDYSGEGYCVVCGTPYQLKWGSDQQKKEADYPYINVRLEAIPMLRQYFSETGRPWGGGTFLILREYPEVVRAREDFHLWWQKHRDEYPELQKEETSA